MSQLIPYRSGLDWPKGDDAAVILDSNFSALAKQADKIGLYLKGSAKISASTLISSTSYIDAPGLKVSVNMTGGLCLVYGSLNIRINANNASYQVLQDSTVIFTGETGSNANTLTMQVPVFWGGNVKSGQTVFNVKIKTDSTPITFTAVAESSLYVFEYSKG